MYIIIIIAIVVYVIYSVAIKVLADDCHHLGYVPRDTIFDVRKFTTLPCKCYVYIGENDGVYFSDCYLKK